MHHSGEMNAERRRQMEELGLLPKTVERQFGATGKFPDGKISDCDEGEIQFGLCADRKRRLIHIDFGTPVVWLSMTPEQAIDLSWLIREKALEVRGERKGQNV